MSVWRREDVKGRIILNIAAKLTSNADAAATYARTGSPLVVEAILTMVNDAGIEREERTLLICQFTVWWVGSFCGRHKWNRSRQVSDTVSMMALMALTLAVA